jgi:hypothetical protein
MMNQGERHHFARVLVVAAACAGFGGCGGPQGQKTYAVTGTATLDGEPLTRGNVLFYPEAPNMPAAMGTLEEGRFSTRAVAGRQRVEIKAFDETAFRSRRPIDPPVYNQIVPARYNRESTLTAEVQTTGHNHFDFALQSDPAEKR